MTHAPYLNSVMDYNIPKMEGYKIHPFNILQIRKGIVTTERHNKDSRFIGMRFHLLSVFLPLPPQSVPVPKESLPGNQDAHKLSGLATIT